MVGITMKDSDGLERKSGIEVLKSLREIKEYTMS